MLVGGGVLTYNPVVKLLIGPGSMKYFVYLCEMS